MAKKHWNVWNYKKLEKRLKEGRGKGEKGDYKPWIYTHDFPSLGFSSRVKGLKTGRVHHLLSNLELNVFYSLEFSPFVLDIREQFPLLTYEDTLNIAKRLGVKHPYDNKTNTPYVLTTDFLVTYNNWGEEADSFIAISVKYKADLMNKRTIEKMAIEEAYWKNLGVKWMIFTEDGLSNDHIRNILLGYSKIPQIPVLKEEGILPELIKPVLSNCLNDSATVIDTLSSLAVQMDVPLEKVITVFYILHFTGYIHFEMDKPFSLKRPLSEISVKESKWNDISIPEFSLL